MMIAPIYKKSNSISIVFKQAEVSWIFSFFSIKVIENLTRAYFFEETNTKNETERRENT